MSSPGDGHKPRDPMEGAREAMRPALARRFYKEVATEASDDGCGVLLDGRAVRTPGGAKLVLPNEAGARLVAAEFAAQGETIDPMTMPATRLANTALDGVAADPQAVLEDLLRYAGTDLLCYRADTPNTLVERQAEIWDPVLDWARQALGARFILSEGVMHVAQPRETIAVLGVHLSQRSEPLRLSALHVMTSLTGSVLLALAVDSQFLSPEEAWTAAHVDEDWNVERWGEDAEAAARRAARWRDMKAAADMAAALRDGQA